MKCKKRKNQITSGFNTVRPTPLYPYDKSTDTVSLPPALEKEILHTASTKGTPVAMKKVMDLTGAGLKVSKGYIDGLLEAQGTDVK